MIEELSPEMFPLANRFFKENGHKGKARSHERVFVWRENGKIIAALRACPKANGYLLRSVWVSIALRRTGLGSQLMQESLKRLSPSPCWCYPYSHLEAFYQRLGFHTMEANSVPEEIASPWLNYQSRGEDFLLMGINGDTSECSDTRLAGL